MAYSDVHRAMLQTLMHEKFMTEENVQAKFAELWGAYSCNEALPTDSKGFKTFFNVINEKIGRLGLKYAEIKQIKDDNMADKYWYASISPDSYSAASSVWLKRCRTDVQGIGKHPKRSQSRKQGIWFVGPENLLRYRAAPLQENHRDSCHRIAVQRPAGPQQRRKHPCALTGNFPRAVPRIYDAGPDPDVVDATPRLVKEGWLRVVEDAAGARGRHNAKRITLGIAALLDAKAYILKQWPDQEERCCVWQADWLFKWVGDESGEQQEADSQSNAAGKRAAPADSEGRKRARAAEADAESEDE
eukprot:235333-Rhodomonas_salina.3